MMRRRCPDGAGKRIVVVGAGLAGLTAALVAALSGARVHVVAAGVGKTHVTPGFVELLDTFDPLDGALTGFIAAHADHPLALAGADAWRAAKALLIAALAAQGVPFAEGAPTNLLIPALAGLTRRAALVPASMAAGALTPGGGEMLIVGFKGWRDFYPHRDRRQPPDAGFPGARALHRPAAAADRRLRLLAGGPGGAVRAAQLPRRRHPAGAPGGGVGGARGLPGGAGAL
ncbi:MAG: FAD-binding protein [Anaerolineae bacterium]|nr:FAD-binding protein [Anaerolineae bacterium]